MSKNKKNKDKSSSSNSILNSSFAQDLKNQISNKHRIDERKDVDIKNELAVKPVVQTKEETKNKNQEVEKISRFDEQLKKEALDPKVVWKRILLGLSLGITSVIPTLSKSSVNSNFSLFSEFKDKMHGLFRPNGFRNWLLYLLWLLPIFAFAIPVFALMFFAVFKISEAGYGPSLLIGFSGVGLVSAIVYYFSNKVKMPFRKKQFDDLINQEKRPVFYIIAFVLAIVLVVIFVVVARFAWSDAPGITMVGFDKDIHKPKAVEFQTQMAFIYLAAGLFAGFASFIPGLSSGLMLALFGNFSKTVYATEISFGANLNIQQLNPSPDALIDPQSWSWPILIVVLVGYALGLACNIFFEKWSSEKFPEAKKVAFFGFMLSSPLISLGAISSNDYTMLQSGAQIGLAVGLFIGLSLLAVGIFITCHYLGFINLGDKIKQRQQVSLNNQEQ